MKPTCLKASPFSRITKEGEGTAGALLRHPWPLFPVSASGPKPPAGDSSSISTGSSQRAGGPAPERSGRAEVGESPYWQLLQFLAAQPLQLPPPPEGVNLPPLLVPKRENFLSTRRLRQWGQLTEEPVEERIFSNSSPHFVQLNS